MGADKNSLQRGTLPISQNHFQILNSPSCQIHVATEVLLDLGASIQIKAITTAAEQTTRVQRPAPVRPVTSTGPTGSRPGHPSNTLRVTRVLPETNRVTCTPTPGHPPNSCDFSQTPLHRSDRCRATVRPVPDQPLRTCPELVQ